MEIYIVAVVIITIIAAILLNTWRTKAYTLPATNQENFIETYYLSLVHSDRDTNKISSSVF